MNSGSGKYLIGHATELLRLDSVPNSNVFAVLHYHMETVRQPASATPVSPVAVFSDSHYPLISAFLRFFNSAHSPPSRRYSPRRSVSHRRQIHCPVIAVEVTEELYGSSPLTADTP